jgi:tetratricopeptide (TPR) repeat protein
VSLDFADTIENISYLLLLDTNDELRNGKDLKSTCEIWADKPNTGFLVSQEWFSGGSYDKYYNTRLVKSRAGWRYKGSVHEYMINEQNKLPMVKLEENIVLYQDRTQDDDKSSKRYARDKVLLSKDLELNPKDARSLFYIAQTCSCLGQLEESLKYYTLRGELDGFMEEKFHAFLRAGDIKEKLKHDWTQVLPFYMRAFEILPRAEPLVKIAEHYRLEKQFLLSYTFAHLACTLDYPKDAILFIEKHVYIYKRYHILGIVAYYAGFFEEGKEACLKAIEAGLNCELDKSNLKFYEEKLSTTPTLSNRSTTFSSSSATISNTSSERLETKTQFVNRTAIDLSKLHPGLSKTQLISKANRMWKDRSKK